MIQARHSRHVYLTVQLFPHNMSMILSQVNARTVAPIANHVLLIMGVQIAGQDQDIRLPLPLVLLIVRFSNAKVITISIKMNLKLI